MRPIPCLLAALVVASAPVLGAERYRLAYSRSADIEIFVTHATGASWCAPTLQISAVHGGTPDAAAFGQLMPKLGGLLDAQCPEATRIEWSRTTRDGQVLARGTSAKADQWAVRALPSPAVAAAPVATPDAPGVAVAPLPEAPAPVAGPTMERPSSPGVAAAPAVGSPVPEPAPAPPVATVAPAPAPAPVPEAPPVVVPAPIADFAVNGWRPAAVAEARRQAGFLSEFQDQNGCRILTRINTRDDARYLALKSDGLECGPDGYATGRGRLTLERSDGARIARTGQLWFAAGLPFTQRLTDARVVASEPRGTLWLYLASDPDSATHYLLRANAVSYGGIGGWQIAPQVDAVTAQADRFRQAEPIRAAIDTGLTALDAFMPEAGRAYLVFSDDFEAGTVAGNANHLLYAINAYRNRRRSAVGPWQFDLQTAQNHVFQRDAQRARQQQIEAEREARRQQQELARAASAARQELRTYQQFVAQAGQDRQALRARLVADIRYAPLTGGAYGQLMAGAQQAVRQIVRVDGSDGEDARVDWPYDMRLVGARGLDEGWYWVRGKVRLDPQRRDGDDLPLTLLEADADAVRRCEAAGCADLLEPLAVTRLTLGAPEWTPEAAEALIERARAR
jgi:hypothetical protein